jgi:hypothetical protein
VSRMTPSWSPLPADTSPPSNDLPMIEIQFYITVEVIPCLEMAEESRLLSVAGLLLHEFLKEQLVALLVELGDDSHNMVDAPRQGHIKMNRSCLYPGSLSVGGSSGARMKPPEV